MPAFGYRHIKDLYPVFWDKSRKLIDKLMSEVHIQSTKENTVVEIGGWGSRAALDIICAAGMGKDFDAIDNPDTELNVTYRKVRSS